MGSRGSNLQPTTKFIGCGLLVICYSVGMKTKHKIFAFFALVAIIAAPGVVFAQGAAPQQLTLTSTLLTMPDYGHFYQGSVPLLNVYYKNGYFVVAAGACAPRGSSGAGSRGQWIFTESGQLIGEQDICDDADVPSNGLHDWSVNTQVQFYGAGQSTRLIREAEWSTSSGRGLLSYGLSDGSFISHIPNNPNEDSPRITDLAVTSDGYAVAIKAEGSSRNNVVYSVPNFSEIGESSYSFTPLTGFGPYVIGSRGFGRDTNLYRVQANGNIDTVQELVDGSAAIGYMFDESSTLPRVTLYVPRQSGGTTTDRFYTFELNGTTVREISSSRVSDVVDGLANNALIAEGNGVRAAILGEYMVLGKCPANAANSLSCGASLQVWRNGELLAEAALPESRDQSMTYPAENVMGVAMSPNGNILAVNRYGAYLYRLSGVAPTGQGTVPGATPAGDIPIADINSLLSIAMSYLRALQTVVGGAPYQSGTSPSDAVYNQLFGQ